jgi:hypothetical protein
MALARPVPLFFANSSQRAAFAATPADSAGNVDDRL